MSLAYLNGIRIVMDQNATIADYEGLVGQAAAEMIQFRETWGDDDFFAISRSGDAYTLQRINGQDVIIMGPVPPPVPEEHRMVEREQHVDVSLMPAFHTFDADKNFIGITICLSGRWGEPYLFVACEKEDIFDFQFGQWNIEQGATRPEDYDEPAYLGPWPGTEPSPHDEMFEIPAVHDYVGRTTRITDSASGQVSGPWGLYAKITAQQTTTYKHPFFLVTDWDSYWDDFWNWITSVDHLYDWYDYRHRSAYMENHGSTSGFAFEDWALELVGPNIYGVDYHSELTTFNGETPRTGFLFSTFARSDPDEMPTIEDGCFLFGLDHLDMTRHTATGGVSSVGDASTASDHVSVFGQVFTLRESVSVPSWGFVAVDNPHYNYSAERITSPKPRIYYVGDRRLFLASFYRKEEDLWEYLLFSEGVEQYNDPDAMFERIDETTHVIPITVNDQPVFGNGEFSLISILEMSEEDYGQE